MATISRFIRGSRIADNAQAARIISNVVDFSLLTCASADIVRALKLDAGTVVLAVGVKVLTAEGAAATCTVGDTGTADKWIASTTTNLNALTNIAATVAAPVYYSAEDYVTLVLAAECDAAKVLVWALVAHIEGNIV